MNLDQDPRHDQHVTVYFKVEPYQGCALCVHRYAIDMHLSQPVKGLSLYGIFPWSLSTNIFCSPQSSMDLKLFPCNH